LRAATQLRGRLMIAFDKKSAARGSALPTGGVLLYFTIDATGLPFSTT
jgi:hypothetical protein